MSKKDVTKTELIAFRSIDLLDIPFIMSTWLRGLRYGNPWFHLIEKNVYYKVYKAVIESILSKETTSVTIACLKDDPEVILGFCVYDGPRLHWVHVKQAWRNIGIARALVPSKISVVSHLTEVGKSLMLKNKLSFNPFFIA